MQLTDPPSEALSDQYADLKNAVVFPHTDDNRCGVLDKDGVFCPYSRTFMGPKRGTLEPVLAPDQTPKLLSGTYLYGGYLRSHFGHFLLESTPRYWALSEFEGQIDGIIFTPFRSGGLRKAKNRYQSFLNLMGGFAPLKLVRLPTQVERLIVADPGFGHNHRMVGSPKYRAYSRGQVARAISPKGPERLYISRSGLPDARGGIFGETLVEKMLEANGFTVFHPQQHSAEDQLAHYMAAKQLVALDGSALHMAAYALQPGAQVAMIYRRRSGILPALANQLEVFADAKVHQLDALTASWIGVQERRVDFRAIGEVDLVRLRDMLAVAGFVAADTPVPAMDQGDIAKTIQNMQRGEMKRIALD